MQHIPDEETRRMVADIERGGSRGRTALRRAELEDLLAVDDQGRPTTRLEGDDHPQQPTRRNLQQKLDKLKHDDEKRAAVDRMTPQEIVDSIPRSGF